MISAGGIFQDAQRALYLDPFKAESGLPLAEDSWDGRVGVLRSKADGGDANTWDVIKVEADELAIGCEEGFLKVLDPTTLGGTRKFPPGTVSDCGIPANIYAVVMVSDTIVFPDGPKNWADVWDVKKFPGKRAMRLGAKKNLEFVLMADGVAKENVFKVLATPEGVDRAFAKLDELKPIIVCWTSDNQTTQLLGSGEVAMTTSCHTRGGNSNKNDATKFLLTFDGGMFMVDSRVIMKGAPSLDNACKLMEFMSRPEVQVNGPRKLGAGVGVTAAQEMLHPALAASLPSASANKDAALTLDASFCIADVDAVSTRFAT